MFGWLFTDAIPNHRPLVCEVRVWDCSGYQCQYSVVIYQKGFLHLSWKRGNVNSLATVDLYIFGYFSLFHIFFSSCNVFSQRCPLLLYSAACGACGFQKCHRFQEVAWNWQSRQNSCCRISPWQASSGALSCSLCIETLSWSKLHSLADCLSDHGNLGQTTLRSLPWDVSHYGQEPRPKGVLWAVKMFNSPQKTNEPQAALTTAHFL